MGQFGDQAGDTVSLNRSNRLHAHLRPGCGTWDDQLRHNPQSIRFGAVLENPLHRVFERKRALDGDVR
jgi:hypothetical protein